MATVTIKLVKSLAGRIQNQKDCAAALGLKKVGDVTVQPDNAATMGKIAKILGPRGLMPNPKSGTVTMEVGKAVTEVKQGKIDFKLLHVSSLGFFAVVILCPSVC